MSEHELQPRARERLRSWVNGSNPDFPDQAERNGPGSESVDPVNIALPGSFTSTESSRSTILSHNPVTIQHTRSSASLRTSLSHPGAHSISSSQWTTSNQTREDTTASWTNSWPQSLPASVNSLHQLQHADVGPEFRISLPESRSTSAVASQTAHGASADLSRSSLQPTNDSLWQLQNAGVPAELQVPLPASVESESVEPSLFEDIDSKDYWTSVEPLLECLPHLRTIKEAQGRYRFRGSVTCIDYIRYQDQPRVHGKLKPGQGFKESVRRLNHITDPNVLTRFILVEDLCAEIIECIGSVFEVDPELFAEHLHRSGYRGMDYDDSAPVHWMPKSHISLKWFRPVKQNPTVTQWMKTPGALLGMVETTSSKAKTVKLAPRSKTWSDPAYNRNGRLNEDATRHRAVINTNIFRRSWTLSTRHSSQAHYNISPVLDARRSDSRAHKGATLASSAPDDDWEDDAIPTAWEERASYFRCTSGTIPIIILLLDPLPSMVDFQTPLHSQKRKNRAQRTTIMQAMEVEVRMSLPVLPRSPFRFPRNRLEASFRDIQSLKHATHHLIPTATALLDHSEMIQQWTSFQADPMLGLLRVVEHDSEAFFRSLEWALDEISHDSLDDYLMSRQLEAWRKLMSDFEIEVPAIGKSLHQFVAFVFSNETLPDEIQSILDRVDLKISRIRSRLVEAYAALRADMQFSEGRRSINEAKTVTKLTELAFIFIPLSFTASLFSMSIHELDDGAPAWTFVVTSLGITLFAYGVRLVLTSEFLADNSRRALEQFWEIRGVERGASAPILTTISLTMQEVWQNGGSRLLRSACVWLFLGSSIVLPIAFAWTTTNLDHGFHAALTVFLLLSIVGPWALYNLGIRFQYRTAEYHEREDTEDEGVDV